MKIIGLAGQKQHGKSTVCMELTTKYKNVVPYSFARPLKEICKILFGGTHEHWYGSLKNDKLQVWDMTPRYLMQRIGTELFRKQFCNDMWVKAAEVFINNVAAYHEIADDSSPESEPVIVIDDVRFDNEAAMLLNNNAKLYRIINDNIPIAYTPEHESEQWLDACYFNAELHAKNVDEAKANAHFIAKELGLCLITTP